MGRGIRVAALCAAPALALALSGSAVVWADLDIEVPVGTPLDWDKELHQPTPVIKTGIPGRKEVKPEEPATPAGKKNETQIVQAPIKPTPPPVMNFSVPNLYNFFRITTMDIMNHISPNAGSKNPVPISPPIEPIDPPTIDTGVTAAGEKRRSEPPPDVRMNHGVQGMYPPKIPGELAWLALAAGLRANLHPATVNKHEAIAYLLEIGEPSIGNAGSLVQGMITDIPSTLPPFPTMKDPIDKMLIKIIVLELVSGYPLGMDPTYAKRTMMMGELGLNSIIECTKSPNTFLARNAVAVLANMQGKKAGDALIEVFKRSTDLCMRIRALAGFARTRNKDALPLIRATVSGGPDPLKAMAIYAYGVVASVDPKEQVKAAQTLAGQLGGDKDMQWTILSAIARLHAQDKGVASTCAAIKGQYAAHKDVPFPRVNTPPGQAPGMRSVVEDPPNTKERILYECALLAAAASGDESSKREALAKGGIESWHPQTRLLAAEVLAYLGDQGKSMCKGLASYKEQNIATVAVKTVGLDPSEADWLKSVASGGYPPVVRAAALTRLYSANETYLKEVCQQIVAGGFSGSDGAQAFLVGIAVQMLDRLNANDGATVLRLVEQCSNPPAIAKRVATDEYDVTKAKIDIFPALLELAVLALGATGYEPGLDKLVSLLKDSPVKAEAALALGSYGKPELVVKAAEALLQGLIDPSDGWVRFACYLSLKNLSGQDHYTDYVFGQTADIWRQALKYRDWLVEYKRKLGAEGK